MSDVIQQRLYVAEATVLGGRGGHGRTSDGMLDVDIRRPVELGGAGGGTNPEQLFAVDYGACFQSAMSLAGKQFGVDTSRSTLTARVALGPVDGGRYGLAVELEVAIPGVEREVAEKILKRTHEVCPYSNATRGNIEVTLKVI